MQNLPQDKVSTERLDRMESHQTELKKDISILNNNVREIKEAIIGNVLSDDKGMVGKLKDMEEELEDLKKYRIENGVYMKMVIGVGAAIGTTFIIMVMKGLIQVQL